MKKRLITLEYLFYRLEVLGEECSERMSNYKRINKDLFLLVYKEIGMESKQYTHSVIVLSGTDIRECTVSF